MFMTQNRLKRGRKGSSRGSFDAAVGQIAAFFQAQTIEKTPPAAAAFYATAANEVRIECPSQAFLYKAKARKQRGWMNRPAHTQSFNTKHGPVQEHVAILAKFTGSERDGDVLLSVKSSSQPLVADLTADALALLGPSL